jgi:membrane-associated protease RseP (regulator of RpoE activity)
MGKRLENAAAEAAEALEGIVNISAVFTSRSEIIIKGKSQLDPAVAKITAEQSLGKLDKTIRVEPHQDLLIIRIIAGEDSGAGRFPWLNLGLFVLTVISTLVAGAFWAGGEWASDPAIILARPLEAAKAGLPFSVSLLAILLFHEFGHYIAGRIHGSNVSLPYFIPAPPIFPFIGTFGALIVSKSSFMNRRQLLDVGAAGPLSGLAMAVIVLIIGIDKSTVQVIAPDAEVLYFGESLLFKLVTYVVKGPIPDGSGLLISSTAFAGWVGTLVTMFNLLPIGQFDGGHIAYAIFGRGQRTISTLVLLGLIGLSFLWFGWAIWIILAFLSRPVHPPTVMDEIPIGKGRRLIGFLCFIAFVICFIPVPLWS